MRLINIFGTKKKLFITLLIFAFLVVSIVNVQNVFNTENKVKEIKTAEAGKYIVLSKSKKSYGPRQIKYNKKELISKSKCSCGRKSYSKFYVSKFYNYCPFCKKAGVMKYRDHHEGEWTCKVCKADFCLVTGKEKLKKSRKNLKEIDD